MKKVKKKLKNNKKFIGMVFILLLAISILSSFIPNKIYGRITGENEILQEIEEKKEIPDIGYVGEGDGNIYEGTIGNRTTFQMPSYEDNNLVKMSNVVGVDKGYTDNGYWEIPLYADILKGNAQNYVFDYDVAAYLRIGFLESEENPNNHVQVCEVVQADIQSWGDANNPISGDVDDFSVNASEEIGEDGQKTLVIKEIKGDVVLYDFGEAGEPPEGYDPSSLSAIPTTFMKYSEIPEDYKGINEDGVSIGTFFMGLIEWISNTAIGTLMSLLTTFLTTIVYAVIVILNIIFRQIGVHVAGASGNLFSLSDFPFPDSIVFNRIPFFDPNFINPTKVQGNIPVSIMQGIISSLYYSFFTIAVSVFAIAALIIGIKLAISTIASEKAQYKEALNNWIFGIALLFIVHFIMAGVLTLNELIVEALYNVSGQISFTFNPIAEAESSGSLLNALISGIVQVFSYFGGNEITTPTISLPGYTGLVIMLIVKSTAGGNLIAIMSLACIVFQTLVLIIMYIKRLFFVIFLGMIAPLIVAVDTIRKSIGQKQSIFLNWLKEFTVIVFTQSFNAAIMMVSMKLIGVISGEQLSAMDNGNYNEIGNILAIVAIAGIFALTKFDSMIKGLFGIENSKFLGKVEDNPAKLFGAGKAALSMRNRTKEAFKQRQEAKTRVAAAKKKVERLEGLVSLPSSDTPEQKEPPLKPQNAPNPVEPGKLTAKGGSGKGKKRGKGGGLDAEALKQLIQALENNTAAIRAGGGTNGGGTNEGAGSGGGSSTASKTEDREKALKRQWDLEDAREELAKAQRDEKAWSKKRFTRIATTVGSTALGLGATGDLSNGMMLAGGIDSVLDEGVFGKGGIDKMMERSASKSVGRDAKLKSVVAKTMEKKVVREVDNLQKGVTEYLDKTSKDYDKIAQDLLGKGKGNNPITKKLNERNYNKATQYANQSKISGADYGRTERDVDKKAREWEEKVVESINSKSDKNLVRMSGIKGGSRPILYRVSRYNEKDKNKDKGSVNYL